MTNRRWVSIAAASLVAWALTAQAQPQGAVRAHAAKSRQPITLTPLIITGRIMRPMVAVDVARLRAAPAAAFQRAALVDRIGRDAESLPF